MPVIPVVLAIAAIGGGAASIIGSRKQSKYMETALNAQARAAQQQVAMLMQVTQQQMAATLQIAKLNAASVLKSTAISNQLLTLQRNNMLEATNNQITILRDNSRLAEENAALSREQSITDADRIRQINRRLVGSQKAAYAKSGVTLEGTPDDVIYDSSLQGEMDALLTQYKGDIEASRSMYQSRSFLQEAAFTRENAIRTSNEMNIQGQLNNFEGSSRANALLFEADLNNKVLAASSRANAYELQSRAASASLQASFVRQNRPWELLMNVTNTATAAANVYYSPSFRA